MAVEEEEEVKVDAEVDTEDVDVEVDGGGGRLHIGCCCAVVLALLAGLDPDALDDVIAPLVLLETRGMLPEMLHNADAVG